MRTPQRFRRAATTRRADHHRAVFVKGAMVAERRHEQFQRLRLDQQRVGCVVDDGYARNRGWPVTGQSEVNSRAGEADDAQDGPSPRDERHGFEDRLFGRWLGVELDLSRRSWVKICRYRLDRPCSFDRPRISVVFRWIERKDDGQQRSAAPALPAQASDAEEPRHVDQPRAGLFRGRHAEGALPALPRREGQGRHGADHDGRLGDRLARQPGRLRQSARLSRRDRAVAAASWPTPATSTTAR